MLAAIVWGVLAVLVAGAIYEQIGRAREKRYPLTGRLVDLGGYQVHATDNGEGGPTVVILHGAGACSYSWIHVREQVARFARVISYDRPGAGASADGGPDPGPATSVAQLEALLERMGVTGPVVLVGHSLGGLIARLYRQAHPDRVAGLVMVDSTHEFLIGDKQFFQGMAGVVAMSKVLRALSRVGLPRFLGALGAMPMYPEARFLKQQLSPQDYRLWMAAACRNWTLHGGSRELGAVSAYLTEANRVLKPAGDGPQYGDLPLAVLTNPGFGTGWVEMHRELAARSSRGTQQVSDQKGHNLHMPRPDLVVGAIRRVVEEARTLAI